MASSFAEAFVKAGIIRPEETVDAKRKKRQDQESKEYREKIEKSLSSSPLGSPATASTSEGSFSRDPRRCQSGKAIPEKTLRVENGEDHSGPPRVRGYTLWLHKTAPILVIEGKRGPTPEEMAAGRRR